MQMTYSQFFHPAKILTLHFHEHSGMFRHGFHPQGAEGLRIAVGATEFESRRVFPQPVKAQRNVRMGSGLDAFPGNAESSQRIATLTGISNYGIS
jgi:hypothetical protein